jgi:hypothetical protein
MKVTFLDAHREPKCSPNPKFPNGMCVDLSLGAERICAVKLPYPAPRCGAMLIECEVCDLRVAVTVAGRVDDPHTVKMACLLDFRK